MTYLTLFTLVLAVAQAYTALPFITGRVQGARQTNVNITHVKEQGLMQTVVSASALVCLALMLAMISDENMNATLFNVVVGFWGISFMFTPMIDNIWLAHQRRTHSSIMAGITLSAFCLMFARFGLSASISLTVFIGLWVAYYAIHLRHKLAQPRPIVVFA